MPRRYRDYKNKGIKLPLVAWLLERPIIFFGMIGALLALAAFILGAGKNSYESILKEYVPDSPYYTVSAQTPPGFIWGTLIAQTQPINSEDWEAQPQTRPSMITINECYSLNYLPEGVLSTHVGKSANIETKVQVYSAGQAVKGFNKILDTLKSCMTINDYSIDEARIIDYPEGFIMSIGDSVIDVKTRVGSKEKEEIIEFYVQLAKTTLNDSQCVSLFVSPKDASRNLYVQGEKYKGLQSSTKIASGVLVTGVPNFPGIKKDNLPTFVTDEPELPLPVNFPVMPEEVEEPIRPSQPTVVNEIVEYAEYEIEDVFGPGCGWLWSGLSAPDYSGEDLNSLKEAAIKKVQSEVDGVAFAYIQKQQKWVYDMLKFIPNVDAWNEYVAQVKEVNEARETLNRERATLKPYWDLFIQQYTDWWTYDVRYKEAREKYDDAVDKCNAINEEYDAWAEEYLAEYNNQQMLIRKYEQEYSQWEKDMKEWEESQNIVQPSPSPSDSSSPTPSPSESPFEEEILNTPPAEPVDPRDSFDVIPEIPEKCSKVERDPILNTEKGPEPTIPSIPEGVTIPNSWTTKEKVQEANPIPDNFTPYIEEEENN